MDELQISLTDELATIELAVHAVALLTAAIDEGFGTDADRKRAPRAASAVAGLVAARLKLVGRAVRGSVDPLLLRVPFNAVADEEHGSEDGDVRLQAWTAEERSQVTRRADVQGRPSSDESPRRPRSRRRT